MTDALDSFGGVKRLSVLTPYQPNGEVFEAVQQIDDDSVDAIVQVGTNLSTGGVFPTVEKMLGKPVIPINVATMWHAPRHSDVNDRFDGLGRLFEEHGPG